ncbi:MAG TPA: hypothetical protein VEA41_18250 [Salinarimonas sp.]|jgi:hypothetical protein|nr:hypothetical protein [Salinarimonas sp.]
MSTTFRRPARSRQTIAVVAYDDGRTAYLWLDGDGRTDGLHLMALARDGQALGTLPDGVIQSVRRVR